MQKEINAIRMLSIDMIEKAQSGHPGICMGASPMMYSLYAQNMKIYSEESTWFNRDRFILSAGHGSAMLYATLHLAGYKIHMNDLKNFRQLNSKTPGHPEVEITDGVDSTSGPLGQGIAQGVGMAIAEVHLAAKYNIEEYNIIDHYTYVLCGDGDLQEGVSSEATSLAGHLKLNKLILLWDSNDVQLDADVKNASSENIRMRYESYNWNTLLVEDGNDFEAINSAIKIAQKSDKPTLIEVKTEIGYGSPNKGGTAEAHGAPLGEVEAELVRNVYSWNLPPFEISEEIYQDFQKNTIQKGKVEYKKWKKMMDNYSKKYPQKYQKIQEAINKEINLKNLEFSLETSEATRVSSGKAINNINEQISNLIGGSADLSKSNNSNIKTSGIFRPGEYQNQNISFGVREFAMGAITNGMNLHGGLYTYCATFFVFSDYLKPALRLSAIQQIPNIFVFTHDSVAVGEDGPTHQPIEQLTGLRAIPNLNVIRPCDANEVQLAWESALKSVSTPTAIILTRQNISVSTKMEKIKTKFFRGAYILEEDTNFDKTIIATGSEISLALKVKSELNKEGVKLKIISMPCMEIFEKEEKKYKEEIFKNSSRDNTYYIEMASAVEGYKYCNNVISINDFGNSGKGDEVINYKGYNVKNICRIIKGN